MTDAPIVAVRGEAVREVDPELAELVVTVSARDRDRPTTMSRLTTRVDALRIALDRHTEAIEHRETGAVHVRPETKRLGERVTAYHGAVTVTVAVADFTLLGELILHVAEQEHTSVAGPWWSLHADSKVHAEARQAALVDAIARGREYAAALGARIERLIELADEGLSSWPARMQAMTFGEPASAVVKAARMRGGAPAVQLDLDPQRQVVRAAVEARFAISEPLVLS